MAKNQRILGACELLEMWGFALGGPEHRLIRRPKSGGESSGLNLYELAKVYVESTPGFSRVRALLVHVHVDGMPVNSFRWRGPGETLLHALLARDWGKFLGYPIFMTSERVYDEFFCALCERCKEEPFELRISGKVA